jgi:asparagine synthase (glutamine-hydrolysing)
VTPNFLIEQALGQNLRVALNGSGGDELFAGYGRYFRAPAERRYMAMPSPVRAMLRRAAAFNPNIAWKLLRAEKFDVDPGAYVYGHTTFFPDPLLGLIGHPSRPQPAHLNHDGDPTLDRETRSLLSDLNTYLPEDLLLLLDRTSMAVSVEGRVPFLDHRVVNAALAVPACVRTANGVQKALQRKLAGSYLPDSVLNAPKRGFASPVPAWMRAGMAEAAKRLLGAKTSLERGWWTSVGLERLFAEPVRNAFPIYSLVMLELSVRLMVETPLAVHAPSATLAEVANA